MLHRNLLYPVLCSLALGSALCYGQSDKSAPAVPPILRVQLEAASKIKVGAKALARTVEPFYSSTQLLLPAGSVVEGKIIAVTPVSRNKRLDAVSHGDFTPLREATLQFDHVQLASGQLLALETAPAQQGSDVVRFQGSTAPHKSLFAQAWASFNQQKDQALNDVRAPGKWDRIKKAIFAQLPWHPQAIEAGTQYDLTLLQPIVPPGSSLTPAPLDAAQNRAKHDPPQKEPPQKLEQSATVHARLAVDLSSRTSRQDDPVAAVVTQPLLDPQGKVEIPQGAVLRGRVLHAQAAKSRGRNGALRFSFNQVDFANAPAQQVAGVPTALDGSQGGHLKLDAEGGVSPDTNKGIALPLAMGLLAASAFTDSDGGISHAATASNGFGLITRIVAISTGSRIVGGVIGSIGTARLIYTRFLAHGRDVTFDRNSQVDVEIGPTHKLSSPVQP